MQPKLIRLECKPGQTDSKAHSTFLDSGIWTSHHSTWRMLQSYSPPLPVLSRNKQRENQLRIQRGRLRSARRIDFLDNQKFSVSWVILFNTLLQPKFLEHRKYSIYICWVAGWLVCGLARWMNEYPFSPPLPFFGQLVGCVCVFNKAIVFGLQSYFNLSGFLAALITPNANNCLSNIFFCSSSNVGGPLSCLFRFHFIQGLAQNLTKKPLLTIRTNRNPLSCEFPQFLDSTVS